MSLVMREREKGIEWERQQQPKYDEERVDVGNLLNRIAVLMMPLKLMGSASLPFAIIWADESLNSRNSFSSCDDARLPFARRVRAALCICISSSGKASYTVQVEIYDDDYP